MSSGRLGSTPNAIRLASREARFYKSPLLKYTNMFKESAAKKSLGRYCCAYSCYNSPVYKKGGLCHKHYARKMRKRNPIKVRYSQMKQKAKVRGISFELTLKEFVEFCKRTGYLSKGYRGLVATVDRIRNAEGYHKDNIQILSNRANARKGDRDENGEPCPF